jgi:hypothetical protein
MTTQLVDLVLATAARLRHDFERSQQPMMQMLLLKIAADVIDCSVPSDYLMAQLRQDSPKDELAYLVAHRNELSMLRVSAPNFQKQRRVRPSQWPIEHARFLRTVSGLVQSVGTSKESPLDNKGLADWLMPALDLFPVLREGIFDILAPVQPSGLP